MPQAKKLEAPAANRVGVTYGDATLDVNILAKPATPYPEFVPTTKSMTTTAVVQVTMPVSPVPVSAITTSTTAAAGAAGPVRRLKLKWAAEDDWPPNGGGIKIPLPGPMSPEWTQPTPLGSPGGSSTS